MDLPCPVPRLSRDGERTNGIDDRRETIELLTTRAPALHRCPAAGSMVGPPNRALLALLDSVWMN